MAIKIPANLHRNRYGILYFRGGVPQDLRHYFATAEIYKSLKTASVKQAAPDAQALSFAFKRIFLEIRQQHMSDENGTPKRPLIDPTKLKELMRFTKQKLRYEDQIDQLDEELAESRRQQLKIKAQHQRDLALVLKAKGMVEIPSPIGDGWNISAYIQPYIDSIRSRRKPPSEQTIKSYEVSARLFVEIIGDKPLHELSHRDRNRYDGTIFKVPKNRQKMPATRGKTLAEMLAIPNLELLSPSTVKDEGLRVNLFLDWIYHQEGRDVPFTLLERFKVEKSDVRQRRLFTDTELRLVFNPAAIGKDRRPSPYKYWLPLIALHTGARIDEIAQINLSDLALVDGIYCFNITDELDPSEQTTADAPQKHLKTNAGKRIVPIHSRLVELGLLEYRRLLREAGHTMLFPDLAHAQIKYGQLASKWFGRYCDGLGLADPNLTFHSFRHGAVTLLTKKGIQRELRKVVIGHSHHEDTHDGYIHLSGMFSTVDKQRAIESLDFGDAIDYVALKQNAPTLDILQRALGRQTRIKA